MIIPRVFFLLPYSRDNQHDLNVAKLQMIKIREEEFDLFFKNRVQKVALLTKHVQTYQESRKLQSLEKYNENHLNIEHSRLIHHMPLFSLIK